METIRAHALRLLTELFSLPRDPQGFTFNDLQLRLASSGVVSTRSVNMVIGSLLESGLLQRSGLTRYRLVARR